MDKTTALRFLAEHQPMPPDSLVTKDLLNQYRAALEIFISDPIPECVPLFLNSFGERDLFGNYIRVSEVLRKLPGDKVIPFIREALNSNYRSVKYWNAEMASEFPDTTLINPLAKLVQEKDVDLRSAAILALSAISDPSVEVLLKKTLRHESEADIRELITTALQDLSR